MRKRLHDAAQARLVTAVDQLAHEEPNVALRPLEPAIGEDRAAVRRELGEHELLVHTPLRFARTRPTHALRSVQRYVVRRVRYGVEQRARYKRNQDSVSKAGG